MDFKLNKEQVGAVLREIKNEKADALIAEGMEKMYQIGKCEGMMKTSRNIVLWAGSTYLTAALIKKVTEKSLSDITDKLGDLQN